MQKIPSMSELRAQLRHLPLNQREIAEKAGLSLSCVAKFLAGHGNPRLSTLKALMRVVETERKKTH